MHDLFTWMIENKNDIHLTRNQNLTKENNNLKDYIKAILKAIKHFFRELLQIGNELTKEATTSEIKDYYDNQDFDMNDVVGISRGTTKQDELYEYVDAPNYLKERVRDYDEDEYDRDDFNLSR